MGILSSFSNPRIRTEIKNPSQRCSYNALLTYNTHCFEWVVDKLTKLADNQHPQISVGELIRAEVIIKNNPIVQQLAKDVGGLTSNFIGNPFITNSL